MYRHAIKDLERWHGRARRKPLVIRGARQVGKTTLVRLFAERFFYWAREKRGSAAEVDYVISQGREIIPVEVKAGKTGTLKSLHLFLREKGRRLAVAGASLPGVGLEAGRHQDREQDDDRPQVEKHRGREQTRSIRHEGTLRSGRASQ